MAHYHVGTISSIVNMPTVITEDITTAALAYTKMIDAVRDLTGAFVMVNGERECIFSDESIVRIKPCEGDCLFRYPSQ